jgi:ABC-type Fe3+/spermidine/putrescine transport system ATPase subunit
METILELRSLSKRFPSHLAVSEVSLQIPQGAFFSLLGPSGCGKTTTLRMIAGFESPTQGEVYLKSERIDTLPPYQRNVNTVFQNYALFPHLTVEENVAFGLRRKGAPKLDQRVGQALEQVRLSGKNSRMPAQLSGGERQRVALARALVMEPDVLLLDEPLSALDPQLRKQVRAELKDLQRRVGVTFLFITHDQEEALSLSDTLAVMNQGKVEQVGAPEEIYRRPRSRFVASFLGAMNWIGPIGLRPEATRISRDGGPPNAEVVGSTFLGPVLHVEVKMATGESVIVQIPHDCQPYSISEKVRVWWNQAEEMRLPE